MYCWKSINLNKDFGLNWLYLISFLIGLLSFMIMYVPFSIVHKTTNVHELGVIYLIIGLLLLPVLHSFMHVLPLIIMHKRAKLIWAAKHKILPFVNYSTKSYLTKKVSLIVTIAPTFFITLPGIIASYLFGDYYVYILLFTSIHIGITFQDFLYMMHITRAPKKSLIENGNNGFDILIKA